MHTYMCVCVCVRVCVCVCAFAHRFQDFYELIRQNLALLPALASDAYFDRKFSSTLITSLVTGA